MTSLPTSGTPGVAVGSRQVHHPVAPAWSPVGIGSPPVGIGSPPVGVGSPPVGLRGHRWARKRAFDIVVAGLLVVALAPLFLLCALAVRLSGPGPVLFRQPRMGRDGRVFSVWKFRSMTVDAEDRLATLRSLNEADGPLFKLRRDPRVTRVGRWLRAWSLDELPQLFNVLRGEMSLVGPRPLPTYEVDLDDPRARGRLRVRPGLTGPWQVSGRSHIPFQDMIKFDYQYVAGWSLARDIEILLATIPAVISGRGAY